MTKLIKRIFLGAVIIVLGGAVIFNAVQSSSNLDKSSSSGGLTASKIGGNTDAERTFNSSDKYTFLGDLDIKGEAIIGNSIISSNKITTDSIDAKNIYLNGNEIGGLEMCRPDGFDYDTICSIPVKEGDTLCPIWMDCDGDGYTYGSGDCDENCADCHVGSAEYTTDPDGRDQNCNGKIDEALDEEICIKKEILNGNPAITGVNKRERMNV